MKIVDFDSMFDEYAARFYEKIKDKYTAEQIEDAEPKLFEKFSHLKIKNIGYKTPEEYYVGVGNGLIDVLKAHLSRGVSVNSFLMDALVKEVSEELLIENLNPIFDGEYLGYIVEILERKESKTAVNRYIDLLFDDLTPAETLDKIVEILSERADEAAEKILEKLGSGKRELLAAEILSKCTVRDGRISAFLKSCLFAYPENTCEVLGFIAEYGDESMLSALYELAESDDVSYLEYKELQLTIEALGGSAAAERDFSDDPTYEKLHGGEE